MVQQYSLTAGLVRGMLWRKTLALYLIINFKSYDFLDGSTVVCGE